MKSQKKEKRNLKKKLIKKKMKPQKKKKISKQMKSQRNKIKKCQNLGNVGVR